VVVVDERLAERFVEGSHHLESILWF
jgi:hypothetical protein